MASKARLGFEARRDLAVQIEMISRSLALLEVSHSVANAESDGEVHDDSPDGYVDQQDQDRRKHMASVGLQVAGSIRGRGSGRVTPVRLRRHTSHLLGRSSSATAESLSITRITSASGNPMSRDVDRAERIGEFWGHPESHTFAELLIECEEDQTSGRCWSGCCGRPKRGR